MLLRSEERFDNATVWRKEMNFIDEVSDSRPDGRDILLVVHGGQLEIR